MEDMLQSQIRESCKLALPEGLKELMSDISREVLRAQPQNIYQFIADYLEALLIARDTLSIACQVCNAVCKCTCGPELYNELRRIGLDQEDLDIATEIIEKHLTEGHAEIKEQSLLLKLMKKTAIDETQLRDVQNAIQKAFRKHQLGHGDILDFRNENKEASEAVHHTLHIYGQNKTEDIFVPPEFKKCVRTASSTSLAGSYVHLPKYRPYSAHDSEILSAIPEKEHFSVDYTAGTSQGVKSNTNQIEIKLKRINFDEIEEKERVPLIFDDTVDIIQDAHYDDEVPEAIETIDSENESIASSITESLNGSIDDHKLNLL